MITPRPLLSMQTWEKEPMTYFSYEEKIFFKQNGYIVKPNTVTLELIEQALEVIWQHIDADRYQAESWINAGPKGNLPCTNHSDIKALLDNSHQISMAEELVGQGSLKVANYPFCKMIYPTGKTDWQLPDRGHMDGYTRPGQVDTFTLGITLNLNDIQHRGGGFTVWPGTHITAAEYFKTHSLLDGQKAYGDQLPKPVEIFGPPGTTCFWHHYLMHNASKNCQTEIRMATVSRLRWRNTEDIKFEIPDNIWEYWEGLK